MDGIVSQLKSSIKNWWVFEVLGALLLVMGFFVFTRPIAAYASLVLYFVLMFFVSGILRIVFSVSNRDHLQGWGWYLAGGIFDVFLGVLLASRMDIATVSLPYFVGFYLLFSSINAVAKSFDLKALGLREWKGAMTIGVLGIIFSALILVNPVLGIASLVTWTALAFISVGAFYITLGLRLRKVHSLESKFHERTTVSV